MVLTGENAPLQWRASVAGRVSVYMELQNMILFGNTVFVDSTKGTIKVRLYWHWLLNIKRVIVRDGK